MSHSSPVGVTMAQMIALLAATMGSYHGEVHQKYFVIGENAKPTHGQGCACGSCIPAAPIAAPAAVIAAPAPIAAKRATKRLELPYNKKLSKHVRWCDTHHKHASFRGKVQAIIEHFGPMDFSDLRYIMSMAWWGSADNTRFYTKGTIDNCLTTLRINAKNGHNFIINSAGQLAKKK